LRKDAQSSDSKLKRAIETLENEKAKLEIELEKTTTDFSR